MPSASAFAVWLPFASMKARPSPLAPCVSVMDVTLFAVGVAPAMVPVKASVRLSMVASAMVTFTESAPPMA